MSTPYRFGTIFIDGMPTPVFEVGDRLYRWVDVLVEGPPSVLEALQSWARWRPQFAAAVESNLADARPIEGAFKWLAPVLYPPKLICIGTNYIDHIKEMKTPQMPEFPYAFLKPPTTTLWGAEEPVLLPRMSAMVDWEAELAFVIGATAREVSARDALRYVAGYAPFHDLSARDWIDSRPPVGIDWVMQKCFDGFAPMGPLITPSEFVPDPQGLEIRCLVNGVVKQESNTANMIFGVAPIIEHLSKIMTLEPGDVVATGTPSGVGFGRHPREFLHPGDTAVVEIEGLGALETSFV